MKTIDKKQLIKQQITSLQKDLKKLEPTVPRDVILSLKKEVKTLKQKVNIKLSIPLECEVYIDFSSDFTNFNYRGPSEINDRVSKAPEFLALEKSLDQTRKEFRNKLNGIAKKYSVSVDYLEEKVFW